MKWKDKELVRQEPIIIYPEFEKEKKRLRELYKLLKAGLIAPRDMNTRDRRLLRHYYGVKKSKVDL